MFIRERLMDNLIDKIINLFPVEKTKYGLKFDGIKARRFSFSKHKSKSGKQYAKFCKIYFGNK